MYCVHLDGSSTERRKTDLPDWAALERAATGTRGGPYAVGYALALGVDRDVGWRCAGGCGLRGIGGFWGASGTAAISTELFAVPLLSDILLIELFEGVSMDGWIGGLTLTA